MIAAFWLPTQKREGGKSLHGFFLRTFYVRKKIRDSGNPPLGSIKFA